MATMPNPFEFAGPQAAEQAVASSSTPPASDAAAEPFDGVDIPLRELMRRGFDPQRFLADCEEPPLFLRAAQIRPIVDVLAGHIR